MFADETCIHVCDACYGNVLSALQFSADEVCNWAANNFVTIHPEKKKTKYMIIATWQSVPLANVSVTVNNKSIERVSHITFYVLFWIIIYLGHIMLSRLLKNSKIYISVGKN